MNRKNDEMKYSGEEKKGVPHGHGRALYNDGSVYEGSWRDGKKEGYGVLITKEGTRYMGQFSNDDFNGYGTLFPPDEMINSASVISGQWKDGKAHGLIVINNLDGMDFAGAISGSKTIGIGCMFRDGSVSAGECMPKAGVAHFIDFLEDGTKKFVRKENGMLSGEQSVIYPDGTRQIANCVNGKPEGLAISSSPDGTVTSGMADSNGMLQGPVTTLYPDGRQIVRNFVNNKPV